MNTKVDDQPAPRIAFLVPPGFDYVVTLFDIWRNGHIAVPLSPLHPPAEWHYILEDTKASRIAVHPDFEERIQPVAAALDVSVSPPTALENNDDLRYPILPESGSALILYTSGTTSKPKGVVLTHGNLRAQIEMMIDAWEWKSTDHILHTLPLHHVHGIVNALLCALWVGAKVTFLPKFDAKAVWQRFGRGDLSLFMGVPTMYAKLIGEWESATEEEQRAMSAGCNSMRLMVSGSAALPVSVLEKWKAITGHTLLERYGMTEIGMALTNPLHGKRVPGHVGQPFPNVELRRVDEYGNIVADEVPGEIEVRSPGVFLEYWNRPDATKNAFRDGWFRTGDMAVVNNGNYRILGRQSVDIIKTGGYKVSALEIEEVLRTHPAIAECAVVGAPDDEWGECVAACLVLKPGTTLELDPLRTWTKERLAAYKSPTRLLIVEQLPRNAMGKVQKPTVRKLFSEEV